MFIIIKTTIFNGLSSIKNDFEVKVFKIVSQFKVNFLDFFLKNNRNKHIKYS